MTVFLVCLSGDSRVGWRFDSCWLAGDSNCKQVPALRFGLCTSGAGYTTTTVHYLA